jgi:hypothetical protein
MGQPLILFFGYNLILLQLCFISFACKESGKIQLLTLNMETKLMECYLIEQI